MTLTGRISVLTSQVSTLQSDLKETKQQVTDARVETNAESIRRQQAEKDLGLTIHSVEKSTREGVASDVRKSPISVQVNGVPETAPLQSLGEHPKPATHDHLKTGLQ